VEKRRYSSVARCEILMPGCTEENENLESEISKARTERPGRTRVAMHGSITSTKRSTNRSPNDIDQKRSDAAFDSRTTPSSDDSRFLLLLLLFFYIVCFCGRIVADLQLERMLTVREARGRCSVARCEMAGCTDGRKRNFESEDRTERRTRVGRSTSTAVQRDDRPVPSSNLRTRHALVR
jgi:hypothetical protein